jgi:hypothetical protein
MWRWEIPENFRGNLEVLSRVGGPGDTPKATGGATRRLKPVSHAGRIRIKPS